MLFVYFNVNWLDHLFHHFPVLCLGLATFPSSDGKPLGPSEPLEAPTLDSRFGNIEDVFMDGSVTMEQLKKIAKRVEETAKKQN